MFHPPERPACRHVVLPQEIAQHLPKGRLLEEVRLGAWWCKARLGRRGGPPGALPASRPLGEQAAFDRAPRTARGCAMQNEWRGLGVQQSRGWVHYAIHRPEPHIMLFRRGPGVAGALLHAAHRSARRSAPPHNCRHPSALLPACRQQALRAPSTHARAPAPCLQAPQGLRAASSHERQRAGPAGAGWVRRAGAGSMAHRECIQACKRPRVRDGQP